MKISVVRHGDSVMYRRNGAVRDKVKNACFWFVCGFSSAYILLHIFLF